MAGAERGVDPVVGDLAFGQQQRDCLLAANAYACVGRLPIQLVVVAELDGLALGVHTDEPILWEERWAEVEHLEAAMRLVLARRLGQLARRTDWIHVDRPIDADEWNRHVDAAWAEVDALRGLTPDL